MTQPATRALPLDVEPATREAPAGESALVARARTDPDAFAALYRLHYPAIARYVRRRTGDEHAAADLVAETFLTALEHLPRYRERGLGAGGSRLLVLHEGPGALPVEEIARLPFDVLVAGTRAELTERADGGLAIAFDDGRGGAFEFVWRGVSTNEPASELETPDGKVRVRVESDDDPR